MDVSDGGDKKSSVYNPLGGRVSSLVAAAHELKAPLALVRQLSLMLEDGSLSDRDKQKMLRQITLTSEKALRLTSDLTKSVRLEDAMFVMEPINPKQLCEDIANEMTPLFEAHNRKLKLVRNRRSLLLIANRDLLRRIIMNFSDNALYYSEEKDTVEINLKSIEGGKTVRLGVRDHGPLVAADALKCLSDKGVLSPKMTSTRPQSSGLGIYLASQFAAAMNGKIGITRHRDGVTFYVDLQASRQMSLL